MDNAIYGDTLVAPKISSIQRVGNGAAEMAEVLHILEDRLRCVSSPVPTDDQKATQQLSENAHILHVEDRMQANLAQLRYILDSLII